MDFNTRKPDRFNDKFVRKDLLGIIGRYDPLGLLIGSFLGVSVAVHAWDLDSFGGWAWLIVLGCVALGALSANFILFNLIYPRLRKFSPRMRAIWILICLLAGFGLLEAIPVIIYPKPQNVRIVALGKKNPASNGSEVWLDTITTGRSAFPVLQTSCTGNWRTVDHLLMSPSDVQPSVLNCRVRTDEDIGIEFVMHGWSGKAQVIYERDTTTVDLYDPGSTEEDLTLDVRLTRRDDALRGFLLIAAGISLGFCLLAVTVFLAGIPIHPVKKQPNRWKTWIAYTLVMAAAWLIYLLAFWPGFLSPDSVSQFMQIVDGPIRNNHPAIHTMLLWLTTRVWLSPAPMVILQMILGALLLGWSIGLLRTRGVPNAVAWFITLFLALSPVYGSIFLNPWKDIPYSLAITAFTMTIFWWSDTPRSITPQSNDPRSVSSLQNQESSSAGSSRKLFLLALVGASVMTALFRHNGIVAGFGVLAAIALVEHRRWKEFGMLLAVSAALYWMITGPFYAALKVDKSVESLGQNLSPYYNAGYLILFHSQSGSILTPDERELLAQFFEDDKTPNVWMASHRGQEIVQAAVAISLRNPAETLRYVLKKASFVFQILQPANARLEYNGGVLVDNPFGIQPDSKLPRIKHYLERIIHISQQPNLDWLLWRNALWMFFLILSCFLAMLRLMNRKILLVLLPVLLNALPFALLSGGDLARYILPTLVVGPLLGIGLLFVQPTVSSPDVDLEV